MAAALRRPYMPWQQMVANVAGEVDANGRLLYNEVVLTVPRQSGKSTIVQSIVVGRAEAGEAFGGRQRMRYAAQTREDARDKWLSEYLEDFRASAAMRNTFTERIANGSEKVTFKSSRSTFGPIATKESSGHGAVLDLGILDEAFAQPTGAVEASWLPAMITRPMAQFWVMSTAGTEASVYFREKVERGRASAESDLGLGTAYFEWSLPEEETDYENEDNWVRCMPALGYTQSIDAIRREFARMVLNDFRRAFLNQWVGKSTPSVLPEGAWNACLDSTSIRVTRPVLAVDIASDRASASIAMAALRGDGRPIVRLIQHEAGTGWLVARILQLRDEYDVAAIVIDGAGPGRSLVDALREEYLEPEVMTAGDMVAACGQFYDAVNQHKLRHFGELPLQTAVQVAERRELSDAWAWTRKKSMELSRADISPLVAVTCALWGQTRFGDLLNDGTLKSFG